jgi:GTPase SAR1 family protein
MAKEDQELNEIMRENAGECVVGSDIHYIGDQCEPCAEVASNSQDQKLHGLVQWTTSDNKRFVPASRTADKLVPAVYEIQHSNTIGIFFEQIPVLTQNLIRFPQTNIDRVLTEIQKFWERGDRFQKYKLPHKRGIMLWGPPGSGKSCTIQLIMRDVVDRGGICVRFGHPHLFIEGMRTMREIEPDTPIVVLMEDIDSTLEMYSESDVLNILDGVNQIDKAVFLATTNYPERLGPRIINRPSRFDKRFKIGHPDDESRRIYFNHLIGEENIKALEIQIDKWVEDTEGFSLAHLKELFVAVVILGDNYEDAVETLTEMKEENISSDHDRERSMGFAGNKKARKRNY